MRKRKDPAPFEVRGPARGAAETGDETIAIAGEAAGDGPPIVLLHGLTATRRYVVLGSRHLEKRGFRTLAYDARGHGRSDPAGHPERYRYEDLVADLEALLDQQELERPVLAGSSMGGATALAYALRHPERVAALVQITPAYAGRPDESGFETWDRLAEGLRRGGVDGFLEAYEPGADPRFHDTVMLVTRQRLERHEHPEAVADAIQVVPRSTAFDGLDVLGGLEVPTLIVSSRDEADPGHPLAVGEAYAERLPNAELAVEEPGKSPLAWQGAQLSRRIGDFLERVL